MSEHFIFLTFYTKCSLNTHILQSSFKKVIISKNLGKKHIVHVYSVCSQENYTSSRQHLTHKSKLHAIKLSDIVNGLVSCAQYEILRVVNSKTGLILEVGLGIELYPSYLI